MAFVFGFLGNLDDKSKPFAIQHCQMSSCHIQLSLNHLNHIGNQQKEKCVI